MIGLSWCYLALLPHVDDKYPIYGLQARGVRRPEPLPVTMAEMAQDYVEQVQKVQPAGPYQLLGWSLGGNIAFAMAEEFERRGEQVGLLVTLDSTLAGPGAFPPGDDAYIYYNIILAQFGYVPALTPADAEPEVRVIELVRARPGLGLDDWPDERIHALLGVIRNNIAVTAAYEPGRVQCPQLLVHCLSTPPEPAEKMATWRSFVDGPIETVELDCEHNQILLPASVMRIGPAVSGELARVAAMAGPRARVTESPSTDAELDALSDDDLDELLRAALAQRNRRQAIADGSDT